MYKKLLVILFVSFSITGCNQVIKKDIPDRMVVLTFDDATASQYSIVAPLLKQYGFGATFFICEFPPNFRDSSKYMNWRQIKELNDMGFEIANHTKDHPQLTQMNREQIIDQIRYIETKCDSMKIPGPVTFAYPGGSWNKTIMDVVKERGYMFARIVDERVYDPFTDNPMFVPSFAMTDDNREQIMGAFEQGKNGKIIVLTVHGVPDIEHAWVNTSPELFKEYLEYLSDNHYKVIALRDLSDYINIQRGMKNPIPAVK
jgi:peptidoglycan/xylan/chitin deacetylase (PgdA/CDA1 family)